MQPPIPEATAAAGNRPRSPWLVLLSASLGLIMVVLNVSMVNIALPTIAQELDATLAQVEWTLIAYTLALVGLTPFFGRTSDVLGRKRLFLLGVGSFASASALAGLAPSMALLILARVAQALGGALITSNVLAIITDTFPAGRRGTAMGIQSLGISGGAAAGPTVGGVLVTHLGWQTIFLINVPVGIVVATVGALALPPLRSNRTLERIDWAGAFLLVGGLVPLLLGVTKAPDWGWSATPVLLAIAGGLVALGLFVVRELRTAHPLVDLSLFWIRPFAAGQAAGAFGTVAMATTMLLVPFYWQALRGYSALATGLFMLPLPLAVMAIAPPAGRLSDRVGARGLTSAGLGVAALSLLLIGQLTAATPVWQVMLALGVLGLGLGTFMAPNNNSVMSSAPAERRGIAAALLGTSRFAGQSLGIAFAGTVFASFASAGAVVLGEIPGPRELAALAGGTAAGSEAGQAFMNGMSAAALFAVPLVLVGALLSLMRGRGSPSSPAPARGTVKGGSPGAVRGPAPHLTRTDRHEE